MSRRMSVSMTLDAVRSRTKTVTRRHVDTWKDLAPGDRLTLIEKGMGLPKGARQVVVADVEIVDVRVEPLSLLSYDVRYGRQEVVLEGFPNMTPDEFVDFWRRSHGYPDEIDLEDVPPLPGPGERIRCRRIEWRYR